MVAIHIPRHADEPWAGVPTGTVPTLRRLPDIGSRPLPDRPTRIRRRRLAALVLVVGLAVLLAVGLGAVADLAEVGATGPQPVSGQPAPVAGQTYVVQPGDTLWTIAEEIAPGDDPRPVVDALRDANGGPELEVGTELILDVG